MRVAFLLGDPVSHSISPLIHNTAFAASGIEARYVAARVPASTLPASIAGLREPSVLGANVTIPHKSSVLGHVEELSPEARSIRAVNTIARRGDGSLVGYNTDAAGFLAPLVGYDLSGAPVLVFGSGGAARAAIWALATHHQPDRLTIVARSERSAKRLVHDLHASISGTRIEIKLFDSAGKAVRDARLIVNTTPLGMQPNEETSPWPDSADFSEHQCIYDLVYRPRRTRLLRDAASRGAETIDGFEMLIQQAASSFELWTGKSFPFETVRKVALQTLAS